MQGYMRSCIFLFLSMCAVAHAGQHKKQIQLARIYDGSASYDLGKYWVSEKLDGVRAYWDGEQLISRQGNVFAAPKWFTMDFPKAHLEGELWIGRNKFELVSGIVRQERADKTPWRQVKLMVFDLPQSKAVFTERLEKMHEIVRSSQSPYLEVIKQREVQDHMALMVELKRIVQLGGEGLMLHRGDSLYQSGRTNDLLKVKTYQDDEALVVGHVAGKGKYKGLLGSLLVETKDGRRFKIGTGFSDEQRANPPEIGDVITYRYFGQTRNGLPRFASFLRVRYPKHQTAPVKCR